MRWWRVGASVVALWLSACGLVTSDPSSGSGGSGGSAATMGSGGSAGMGASSSGGNATGGAGTGCPIQEPNFGAPCAPDTLVCPYGPCVRWDCLGGAFVKVDKCAGPNKKCGELGAVCQSHFWDCSCGITGEWTCEGGGEDIPEPWEDLPHDYELDGKPCSGESFQCLPEGSCGPLCSCVQGTWSCAKSVACADPPCPPKTPTGTCPALGQKCQYTGFCAPTCSCILGKTDNPDDGLVQQWACLSPPC